MAERSFSEEVELLRAGAGTELHMEGILAVTKALLQSGVAYVGGYQGAPISHLMDVLNDAQGILGELGVHFETNKRGARADFLGTTRAWTEDEVKSVRASMEELYGLFLQRVTEGRKNLKTEQVDYYNDNGFLFPVDVFTPQEAQKVYEKYAQTEAEAGEELQKRFRVKAHLPFPFLCDIIRNEKLVDAVEDIIGPNVMCWGSSFFSKNARDPRFISWHTDSFYYAFEPAETTGE